MHHGEVAAHFAEFFVFSGIDDCQQLLQYQPEPKSALCYEDGLRSLSWWRGFHFITWQHCRYVCILQNMTWLFMYLIYMYILTHVDWWAYSDLLKMYVLRSGLRSCEDNMQGPSSSSCFSKNTCIVQSVQHQGTASAVWETKHWNTVVQCKLNLELNRSEQYFIPVVPKIEMQK